MRDLPVLLSGYKLTVVDPPMPKTREDAAGRPVVVVDREGVTLFVVSVFAKQRVAPGMRAPKGEEIKVTLACDPGEGFEEDTRIELVDARINVYEIKTDDGRTLSGMSFKAASIKHASPTGPTGTGEATAAAHRSDR